MTRAMGVLTVLAATFVTAFSVPVRHEKPIQFELFHWTERYSDDWAERVAEHLGNQRFRIERGELEHLIELVDRSASQFQVDPLTVLAMIHVESHFDTFAVSPVGAKGLMQLRARTAEAMAERLGLEWSGEEELHEAELNVLLGTYYFRTLVDRFGNLDEALAAFNEGPTRVQRRKNRAAPLSYRYADRVRDALVDLQALAII